HVSGGRWRYHRQDWPRGASLRMTEEGRRDSAERIGACLLIIHRLAAYASIVSMEYGPPGSATGGELKPSCALANSPLATSACKSPARSERFSSDSKRGDSLRERRELNWRAPRRALALRVNNLPMTPLLVVAR